MAEGKGTPSGLKIDPKTWRADPERDPFLRQVFHRPGRALTPSAGTVPEGSASPKAMMATGVGEFGPASYVYWDVPANRPVQLYWGPDNPLVATYLSFQVGPIAWRAGTGWPVYTTTAPQHDLYLGNMLHPQVSVHAIWMSSPGYNPFELQPDVQAWNGWLRANGPVPWLTGVNDDPRQYADNEGGYRFTLFTWW